MNDWLYLLLIPALLILVWFWPEQKGSNSLRRRSTDNMDAPSHNQFHAVSIEPCSHACDAVLSLHDKRFLANEAMSLPVPGCDASRCQCTYKHYADRRAGDERRRASVAMRERFSKYEQRHGGDRRRHHAYQ